MDTEAEKEEETIHLTKRKRNGPKPERVSNALLWDPDCKSWNLKFWRVSAETLYIYTLRPYNTIYILSLLVLLE